MSPRNTCAALSPFLYTSPYAKQEIFYNFWAACVNSPTEGAEVLVCVSPRGTAGAPAPAGMKLGLLLSFL